MLINMSIECLAEVGYIIDFWTKKLERQLNREDHNEEICYAIAARFLPQLLDLQSVLDVWRFSQCAMLNMHPKSTRNLPWCL